MIPVSSFIREIAPSELVLRVRGRCMEASIPAGSRIRIRPVRWPMPGDVVVVPTGARPRVHRVIGFYRRRGELKVLTQADRARRPDAAVAVSEVLGRVSAVDGMRFAVPWRTRLASLRRFVGFALEQLRG